MTTERKRCQDHKREVPKKLMQEGIDLCKRNVTDFLNEARLIVSKGNFNHATVSVEFAIEEFGKILILKDTMKSTRDPVSINGKDFCSHHTKSEKAWKILDQKYRTIFDQGVWEPGMWERGVWVENIIIDHVTRCDCAFVEFSRGRWLPGPVIKKDRLQELISHVEEKLKTL